MRTKLTTVLHVDDLFCTCVSQGNLDKFGAFLSEAYPEIRTKRGKVINYIGVTFDYTVAGEVKVNMDKCVNDILSGCRVDKIRSTPATENLFDVRDSNC